MKYITHITYVTITALYLFSSCSSSPVKASDIDKSVTGWKFFESVQSSNETTSAINATFELSAIDRYMNVFIPSGIRREYSTALVPYTKRTTNEYKSNKTPVITMRKFGEAWEKPFVAIYEPEENSSGKVKSTSLLKINNKVVGAIITSVVNGVKITDFILSNDNDDETIDLSSYGQIYFTGRFGIIRSEVKDGKTDITLYIGKGSYLKFNSFELTADTDDKGILKSTLDYEFDHNVSIGDYITLDTTSVYPNPSKSGFFSLSRTSFFKIYNLNGNLIKEGQGDSVDLTTYCNGIYLMQDNNRDFIKLIKQ